MGLKRWFASGVLCFLASTAHAEWKGSVNGDVTLSGNYWTNGKLPPDDKPFRPVADLRVPMTLKNGRALKFRLLPTLESDQSSPSKNERFFWDIQEGYVQYQTSPWTFQVGQNVQTWGDTDVFNPLDVVNTRRYFDPLNSQKLGAPTVLIKRDWENFFIEALYIPKQRETLVPGEESRWLPRDVYRSRRFDGAVNGTNTSGEIILPANMQYQYGNRRILDNALDHNFGARAKFRLSGFDWTIAGFQGAATTPAVNIDMIGFTSTFLPGQTLAVLNVTPDIRLRSDYYKDRTVGTSFVWVLGDFLVKGVTASEKPLSTLPAPSENLLPKSTWQNALGLERTLPLGAGTLTVLLQGTYVQHRDALDTNSVSLSRMFDRAVMTGLRWAPGERFTAVASLLYDTKFKGDFEHLEASYKIHDGWLGKVSGDLLGGPPETPTGTYRRNDRVTVSLNVQQ